jgi:AraC-type DNA-binding domain-containing proteins
MLYLLLTSLPLMTCVFFTVYIVLELRNKELRELPALFYYMLAATVLYAGHFTFFNHAVSLIPFTDTLYLVANLAVYPLYLIYIIRLTTRFQPHYWLLLLPAVIGGITTGILYTNMSSGEINPFINTFLYQNHTIGLVGIPYILAITHIVCRIVFAIEVIFTVIIGFRLTRRYDRMVDSFYSDTEEKSSRKIRTILYLIIITAVLSFIFNVIGRYRFIDSTYLLAIPSFIFSALLFYIGYVGIHRHFSFQDLEFNEEELGEEYPSGSNLPQEENLKNNIIQRVKEERIYLQPNLKIEDLARLMNTNRTYIYQAINQQMGITFHEFINRQRIEYAEKLMAENPGMPINDVALHSGYTSPSSFYRNLKKYQQKDGTC